MPEYRLYCLSDEGRFTKSHQLPARNDEEALALAKVMKLPTRCEIWDRGRMVAELPAYKR